MVLEKLYTLSCYFTDSIAGEILPCLAEAELIIYLQQSPDAVLSDNDAT